MEVISDLDRCPRPGGGCVVTIGAYDGVHLGHRALIGRVRSMAADLGCVTAVVTFDRHPIELLKPGTRTQYLTPIGEKLRLIAALGVDATLLIHLSDDFLRLTAEGHVLVGRMFGSRGRI